MRNQTANIKHQTTNNIDVCCQTADINEARKTLKLMAYSLHLNMIT